MNGSAAALWLAGGFCSGVVCTWVARSLALRWGVVALPNPIIPQHTRSIALLGGVGVAAGIAVCCLSAALVQGAEDFWPSLQIGVAALPFLVLGVIDDLRALAPGLKFALQALAALTAVSWLGPGEVFGHVSGDFAFSVWWVLIVVNAFNLTDVCDGLVGGLSALVLVFLGCSLPNAPLLAFCGAGACLGFLVFNRPPASIYLGDGGSHVLGFLAAILSLGLFSRGPVGVLQALLILAVPLFELVFLTGVRIGKGIPWWRGSPDHFALRLQAAGLSRIQSDTIAWVAAAGLGALALALPELPVALRAAAGVLLVSTGAVATLQLLRFEVTPSA